LIRAAHSLIQAYSPRRNGRIKVAKLEVLEQPCHPPVATVSLLGFG
jgi:hypothetical protein